MTPVACGPGAYKVSPHFRANGQHAAQCRSDGLHPDARRAETRPTRTSRGFAEPIPARLLLARIRPQRRDPDTTNPEAVATRTYRRWRDAGASPTPHESTASTLHGIADVYCRYPAQRSRRLRVPGCAGRTYRECFRPLNNASGYVRHEPGVLFAPIRFRRPAVRGHTVTIEPVPAVWLSPRIANRPTPPDAVYRVSFLTGSWTERERDRLPHEVHEAVANQMRDHRDQDRTWRTYLFFLGAQDAEEPATFRVEDHRLACFFLLHKNDYRNL